jgi:predicted ATPase
MINQVHLLNFKGHVDTTVPLGRLTMLAGDNASGKTSVLEALQLMSAMEAGPSRFSAQGYEWGDLLRRGADLDLVVDATGTDQGMSPWRTILSLDPRYESQGPRLDGIFRELSFAEAVQHMEDPTSIWNLISSTLGTATLFRLRAEQVAAAAYSDMAVPLVGIDGSNTAVVLASVKLGNDELFDRIETAMRKLIPSLLRIRLKRASVLPPKKGSVVGQKIYFDFQGASDVPAHGASYGTLIVLALLTVLFGPSRPNLILLDDFDHALHPRAQMELVRMLKQLLKLEEFENLQIAATTHSPYTLDELDPSDVQVFALRPDGTVTSKRLDKHPDAEKTKGALRAGQLWSLDSERDWVIGA